jgi:hypothetical protein
MQLKPDYGPLHNVKPTSSSYLAQQPLIQSWDRKSYDVVLLWIEVAASL